MQLVVCIWLHCNFEWVGLLLIFDERNCCNSIPTIDRSCAAMLLIQEGALVGVTDAAGTPVLSLLIELMPVVAAEALSKVASLSSEKLRQQEFKIQQKWDGMSCISTIIAQVEWYCTRRSLKKLHEKAVILRASLLLTTAFVNCRCTSKNIQWQILLFSWHGMM